MIIKAKYQQNNAKCLAIVYFHCIKQYKMIYDKKIQKVSKIYQYNLIDKKPIYKLNINLTIML